MLRPVRKHGEEQRGSALRPAQFGSLSVKSLTAVYLGVSVLLLDLQTGHHFNWRRAALDAQQPGTVLPLPPACEVATLYNNAEPLVSECADSSKTVGQPG